jgi:hypothetical protein
VLRAQVKTMEARLCPLCRHQSEDADFPTFSSHCIFGGGDLLRRQCPSCDVIFGADKMFQLSAPELAQDYEWHYRVYEEGDSTAQELRAFHSLRPSKDKVYLNYGAGAWSRSVQQLRSEGWNVFAFEPHGSAATQAEYLISSHAELNRRKFDGIFSNNVLEHLRHPVKEIAEMAGLLNAEGSMAHATPCFEYAYEYTRFHLFFFLGKSRELLVRGAGLTVKEFISDGEFMCCIMTPAPR